jgi:hypothetical protein
MKPTLLTLLSIAGLLGYVHMVEQSYVIEDAQAKNVKHYGGAR